jgi:hypothetical protein
MRATGDITIHTEYDQKNHQRSICKQFHKKYLNDE